MATAADAQTLLGVIGCNWCNIPLGLLPYVTLAVAIDIGTDMPVPTEPNELMAQAACLCKIPAGEVAYAQLAILIDVVNGDPVPSDPNEILAEATCLHCISAGLLPYVTLEVMRNLS
jgi:hypothetical protein